MIRYEKRCMKKLNIKHEQIGSIQPIQFHYEGEFLKRDWGRSCLNLNENETLKRKLKWIEVWHLIIGKEGHIARVGDCQNLPISQQRRPGLEQPANNVFITIILATTKTRIFSLYRIFFFSFLCVVNLVKTSNSKLLMQSLQVRSIVDLSAIASRPEDIACTYNQRIHDDFICFVVCMSRQWTFSMGR